MSYATHRTETPKRCLSCGTIFYPFYGRQTTSDYCSRACYLKARWGNTPENKCLQCGKDITGKRSQKFCSVECRAIYQRGIAHSDSRKELMSRSHKRRIWTPARKAQLDEARKHRRFSDETRAKIRANRMKQQPQPHINTSIEIMLQQALTRAGIIYKTHQPINGICIPDIVIPEAKLAIFADGDYWHSLSKVKKRDAKQDLLLIQQGWLPLRFPESFIRSHAGECAIQIKNHLATTLG